MILAAWAAIAIENARLYEAVAARRDELEQSARRLEAARAIAVAVGAEMELEKVLELIAKRGRALVEARSLVILLREGADLVVAASAGVTERAIGARVPIAGSTTGQVLESRTVQRDRRRQRAPADLRRRSSASRDARTALLAPLVYRGRGLGVLAAFDRGADAAGFSEDDEATLRAFAASGATAVALAQTVQHERLRHSLDAAEAERRRWARELHDETLQGLGGLRVILVVGAAARRAGRRRRAAARGRRAGRARDREPARDHHRAAPRGARRARPRARDRGARRARERRRGADDRVRASTLPGDGARLGPELETTVYRLVQEALTNVAKHARAEHARVAVSSRGGRLDVEVSDDGSGLRRATP